jgi:mono/diheme cytochrome c family protein
MKLLTMVLPLGGVLTALGIGPFLATAGEGMFAVSPSIARPDSVQRSPSVSVSARDSTQVQEHALLAVKIPNEERRAADSEFHAPTFYRDVLPIVIGKCYRCHNQQTTFLNNWVDYNTTFGDRWELKRRVWDSWKGDYFKQPMPTINSPESEAITEEERIVIKQWVDTGAVRGVAPAQSDPHSKAERVELGKRVFSTICAACHQSSGYGIPNRFPPLAGSDFLNSDKQRAIKVVLNGLQGEVVVNGQKFNNTMPLFPLSDGEIAAALTYVYNSFGNSGQDVTAEEVKSLRGTGGVSASPASVKSGNRPQDKSPWE